MDRVTMAKSWAPTRHRRLFVITPQSLRLALGFLMLLLGSAWGGCRPTAATHEPVPAEPATESLEQPPKSTIVIHGLGHDIEVVSAVVIRLGNGGIGTGRDQPRFEGHTDEIPATVECLRDSLCNVGVRRTRSDPMAGVMFEVVAADPTVEVRIQPMGEPGLRQVRAQYVEADSRSAQLAALLEREAELVQACRATVAGRCGGTFRLPDRKRVVPGYDPRVALSRLKAGLSLRDESFATWAYFDAGCPDSSIDSDLAREALQSPIDPVAKSLFPVGVGRAILAAEGVRGAEARLDDMGAPGDRDLAAALLREMIHDARRRHDFERAAALHGELNAGNGAWAGSLLATGLLAQHSVIGAPVGSLSFRTLEGERRTPNDVHNQPVLVYTAASWCKPCHGDLLEELRRVAAKHPELTVLYVLWDKPEAASAFATKHAPIPGTVVLPDEEARKKLEVLLGAPSFPSFLLIDAEGRVAAIPGEEDLETAVRDSGVLEASARQ